MAMIGTPQNATRTRFLEQQRANERKRAEARISGHRIETPIVHENLRSE